MTNFTFNGNVIIANNVLLSVGQNTFVITVRNASGQAVIKPSLSTKNRLLLAHLLFLFFHQLMAQPLTCLRWNLNAVVTNVTAKSNITVKLNGQVVNGFQFSGSICSK